MSDKKKKDALKANPVLTITNRDAVRIFKACKEVAPSDVRLPSKFTYVLGRNLNRVRKLVTARDESIMALNKSYDFNNMSPQERVNAQDEFNKEVNKIEDEQVEFQPYRIKYEEIDGVDGLVPEHFATILEFIVIDEE